MLFLKDLEGVSYVADEVKKGERIKKHRFHLPPVPYSRKLPRH